MVVQSQCCPGQAAQTQVHAGGGSPPCRVLDPLLRLTFLEDYPLVVMMSVWQYNSGEDDPWPSILGKSQRGRLWGGPVLYPWGAREVRRLGPEALELDLVQPDLPYLLESWRAGGRAIPTRSWINQPTTKEGVSSHCLPAPPCRGPRLSKSRGSWWRPLCLPKATWNATCELPSSFTALPGCLLEQPYYRSPKNPHKLHRS